MRKFSSARAEEVATSVKRERELRGALVPALLQTGPMVECGRTGIKGCLRE